MHYDILFFVNSIMLGVGLAMDAFSVSVTNGIVEPEMKSSRRSLIAGTYAFFQFIMPMIGWLAIHTVLEYFNALEKFTPVIALILLLYIGIKMIVEGVNDRKKDSDTPGRPSASALTARTLIIQGVATSIDALSVGVTFAEYDLTPAFIASLIIAAVTFGICIAGLHIGHKVGRRFSDKATVIGGCILIFIGLEIFFRGVIL